MHTSTTYTLLASVGLLLGGCAYTEDALNHFDFNGTVRIPVEAVQVEMRDDDNETWTIDDPRAMGPIYMGVFPSVVDNLYDFSHPEIGPVTSDGQSGDAYPLGGNTVGRFEWGCYQQLICQTVTGRYSSYDDVLEFFRDEVRDPILDTNGQEVTSGIEYQEQCFEYKYATDDYEIAFIDDGQLDFALTSDGQYYEAETSIPHVPFYEGMTVWGWADMPSEGFGFTTCNSSIGESVYYYEEQYDVGSNFSDVLNFPGTYIDHGDYVENEGYVLTSTEDEFVLELGFRYED